jgi:hypothetical protein
MSVPYYSIQSGPAENQRSYKCQVTGTVYPYAKGSSTDGVDEKAVALAALTAGQTARITTLRNGGYLQTKEHYTLEELRAAQAESLS